MSALLGRSPASIVDEPVYVLRDAQPTLPKETAMNEPDVILKMLGGHNREPRCIAVVGLSDDPTRPSHSVSAYMQRHGYRIVPVNPGVSHVLGERAYPSLRDVPDTPDIVNVFRLPRYIPAVVDEMIEL